MEGNRTRIFGIVVMVLGIAQEAIPGFGIPENVEGYIMAGVGALILFFRQITTGPPGGTPPQVS